jgi:hypothetical protein
MKELRHLFFNFGEYGEQKTRTLLERYRITRKETGAYDPESDSFCHLMMEADDPRFNLMLDEISADGGNPKFRAERTYTDGELKSFPWLRISICTTGILGGANLNQPYDRTHGCHKCGAGSTVIPPLIVDLNKIGKRKFDRTCHDGHIVVASDLAKALQESGLSGFSLKDVRHRTHHEPDSPYQWMAIDSVFPKMTESSIMAIEEECPVCHRAGHFDSYERLSEWWFEAPPPEAMDFNYTWEYFGVWYMAKEPVGGEQGIVISQAARQFLIAQKVHRLDFHPVYFEEWNWPIPPSAGRNAGG